MARTGPVRPAEYLASLFGESDTWVLGRKMYEIIVPWWDDADLEFAAVQHGLRKILISRSLPASGSREVLAGDVAGCILARYRVVPSHGSRPSSDLEPTLPPHPAPGPV
jgi:hypothetical protein